MKVAAKPAVTAPGPVPEDPPMLDLSILSFKEGDVVDRMLIPLVADKVSVVLLSPYQRLRFGFSPGVQLLKGEDSFLSMCSGMGHQVWEACCFMQHPYQWVSGLLVFIETLGHQDQTICLEDDS